MLIVVCAWDVCVEAGTLWVISVAFSQFCYEAKTALKYEVLTALMMTADDPIEGGCIILLCLSETNWE